ncbi:MAG: S1 RNA-binding domain-containing protein, partial [Alphaproteobacteria bacterium]|nr:S1 RNA-binding domain-containing protein [Alphaproteobacteria bacterium]
GASLGLCERRAAVAERNTLDRFKAAFLEDSVGDTFSGLISGVTRFGLFVTIDKIGADGLIPMSRLGQERFRLASGGHALTGRQGQTYRIGQAVDIVLSQVDPVSGSALFDLAGAPAQRPGRRRGRAR